MKALTGTVVAILTVVLVIFGFGLRTNSNVESRQAPVAAAAYPAVPGAGMSPASGFVNGAQVVPVGMQNGVVWPQGVAQQPMAAGQPLMVNCGPGTQTLVRQAWLNGQQVSQVECLPAATAAGYPVQQVRTVVDSGHDQVRMAPRRTVYTQAAPRRVARSQRSWQKTALVIGGSSAAAAGVGGLLGGKKGALIGAAIGGGASTIYEAAKRR